MSQKLSPLQEAGVGPLQRSAPTLHPHSPSMICLWSHLQPGFKTPFGHLPSARCVLTTQTELGVPLLTSHRICCSPVGQLPTPSLFPCLSLPRGQAHWARQAASFLHPGRLAGMQHLTGLSLNIRPRLVLLRQSSSPSTSQTLAGPLTHRTYPHSLSICSVPRKGPWTWAQARLLAL